MTFQEWFSREILIKLDENYNELLRNTPEHLSPDFVSDKIGLEVTILCDEKHKEMSGLFTNMLNSKGNIHKQYDKIVENGGDILFNIALATKAVENVEDLFKSIYNEKLFKLNSIYDIRKSNEIFILADIKRSLSNIELDSVKNFILSTPNDNKKFFNKVFLLNSKILHIYDLSLNEYTQNDVSKIIDKIYKWIANNVDELKEKLNAQ